MVIPPPVVIIPPEPSPVVVMVESFLMRRCAVAVCAVLSAVSAVAEYAVRTDASEVIVAPVIVVVVPPLTRTDAFCP